MTPYRKSAPAKKTYRKKASTATVSTAVKKYVKQVTAKAKPEMKQLFSAIDESVLNTISPSFIFSEFELTQGVGAGQRIGNSVNLQGLHIKGVLHNPSTTCLWVRRLVLGYSDSVQTGIFTELFKSSGTGNPTDLSVTVGLNSIYTAINKAKFKVYDDTWHKLSSSASIDGSNTRIFNKFVKFGGSKIMFEGNTTGFTNQNKRYAALWMVAEAPDDTSAGVNCELSAAVNWYFTDP